MLRLESDELPAGFAGTHTLPHDTELTVVDLDHEFVVSLEDDHFMQDLIDAEGEGRLPDYLVGIAPQHFVELEGLSGESEAFAIMHDEDRSIVRSQWSASESIEVFPGQRIDLRAELAAGAPDALHAELLAKFSEHDFELGDDTQPRKLFVFKTALVHAGELESAAPQDSSASDSAE